MAASALADARRRAAAPARQARRGATGDARHARRALLRTLLTALGSALLLLLALAALVLPPPAQAHPMPESRAWLDTRADGLLLTLQMPLNRLEFGFGQPLLDAPDQVLPRHGEALARYLLLHVGARSPGPGDAAATSAASTAAPAAAPTAAAGPGWQVLRPQLTVLGDDGNAELQATLRLRAPPGADPRRLVLWLDAVTHEVRTHRIQVLLRNDWHGGRLGAGDAPQPLATLDSQHTTLALDLAPAPAWQGLLQLLRQGALHIAEGSDHLLFVLLLLLAAPGVARAGRWQGLRPPRGAWRHVAGVVSAFTLGHSVTLALASFGLLTPPAAWVELAVAATLAVAALHAGRPLWPGAELAMAGGFGLVHGLAFAGALSAGGLSPGQLALALLAFNAGIELMQLALLLLVLPALLLVARRAPEAWPWLRGGLALAGAAAALLWLAQRAADAFHLPPLPALAGRHPLLQPVLVAWDAAQAPWQALGAGAHAAFQALPLALWLLAVWACRRPRRRSAGAATQPG